MCSSCYVFLLFDELQFFGKFYPFVLTGYLYGAALELAQEVGAVVADDEFSIDGNRLFVQVQTQEDIVFIIRDDTLKGLFRVGLCREKKPPPDLPQGGGECRVKSYKYEK